MPIRRPVARSASLGGDATIPLTTETPPASSPPTPTSSSGHSSDGTTPTSSSSHSSDGTQSTSQQMIQSLTSLSSSPTVRNTISSLGTYNPISSQTPGEIPSASISTTFSSSSQSDGTSTNYKESGPSTDMSTSPSTFSQSPMSTGEGGQSNGSSSGGGITALSPTGGNGGTSSQISLTTFGPVIGPSPSVSSGDPSLSLSDPGLGDLPSMTLPTSLLPSLPTLTSISLPSMPTSISLPSIPTSISLPSILTSISLPPIPTSISLPPIPTSISLPPTQKPSVPSTTSLPTISPGQQTITQSSSTPTPPTVGNPTTTSSASSSSADEPSTTTDTNLSTTLPGKQTSSSQSTSQTTSPTSSNPNVTSTNAGVSSQYTSSSSSSTNSYSTTSTSPEPTATSQTTSGTSTPITSSSQGGSLPSLLSSIVSPLGIPQSTQSSTTTSATSTGDSSLPWSSTGLSLPITPVTTDSQTATTPTSSQTQSTELPVTTPQSSQTDFSESPTTTLPTTFFGGLPTTVTDAESSLTLQSPGGSPTELPSTTGYGVTVSSAGLPTTSGVQSSDNPVGGSSSTTQGTTVSTTSYPNPNDGTPTIENFYPTAISSSIPSWETESSIIYTSKSVFTQTIITSFGTSLVTLTSTGTSTFSIPTSTLVPKSGTRSNEVPIIGGVVGGVLALLFVGVAACCLVRRRRRLRTKQRLYDSDLTAALSPAEAMRENHAYRPTYTPLVGGQVASESRGNLHHASDSFGSSTFPHPSIAPGSSRHPARNLSDSLLYENDRESNDGDVSSDDESEGTESAPSFYASENGQSSVSGGVGIAIGSQSSTDIHSYHTAATTLVVGAHAIVDNDEEWESPGPSPSSFPIPPSSMNPFSDGARVVDLPDFVASHVSQSREVVSASYEKVVPVKILTFLEQQASWAAALAAASPVDAPTPTATQSFNALIDDGYDVDTSNQDLETPTQSPFNDSSYIVNPFLRETSQEGFSDDSEGSDSDETVAGVPHGSTLESKDKGKGKEQLSADFGDDPRRNRLSSASSGLEFPDNASQCGIAL